MGVSALTYANLDNHKNEFRSVAPEMRSIAAKMMNEFLCRMVFSVYSMIRVYERKRFRMKHTTLN